MKELASVRRAAKRAAGARNRLDEEMRQAYCAGASLRMIAKEADLSPEWVRQRIRQQIKCDLCADESNDALHGWGRCQCDCHKAP